MKHLILILACLGLGLTSLCAQSQQEMNREAGELLAKADKKLNLTYQKLRHSLDAADFTKLQSAQRLWLTFREEHATFNAHLVAEGGSMYPMIYAGTAARLTEERTKQLEELLSNVIDR